jgi:putative membrane protein
VIVVSEVSNMKSFAGMVLVLALSSVISQAQTPAADAGNPANKSPSGMPIDANFMKALAVGGVAELEAGKLATQRGTRSEVKTFATQMVNDHSANNDKLKALAKDRGVELPAQLDAEHAADKAKLETLNGTAFDVEYIRGQIKDHQKAVQLLQHQINAGQDANVRRFAQETLPTVQHHLEMAKDIHAKVSGQSDDRDKNRRN